MAETLTLSQANKMIEAALAKGAELALNPLTVAVLDAGGHLVALARQDGSSPLRPKVAQGKANGAVALGMSSRKLFERAQQQAYFVQSLNGLTDGNLVPVPGGVLVRDSAGAVMGAVGITGDTSDNDEICAIAGIEATGLTPDA